MIRRVAVLVAVLVMAWAPTLSAQECLIDMKEIDEALAKNQKLSADQLAQIKKWREEGEKLCKAGKHKESEDTLEKAKLILGI